MNPNFWLVVDIVALYDSSVQAQAAVGTFLALLFEKQTKCLFKATCK